MIESRLCPRIESPCTTLPKFNHGQKSAFCGICQKTVYNLSAHSANEQRAVLAAVARPCVRYRHALTVAAVLAASSAPSFAQDASEESGLEPIMVTGGGARRTYEPVMLESEREENLDEPQADAGR